jgi:hypothetical protein
MAFHTRFVSWGLSDLLRDGPVRKIRARARRRAASKTVEAEKRPSAPAKSKSGTFLTPLPSQR